VEEKTDCETTAACYFFLRVFVTQMLPQRSCVKSCCSLMTMIMLMLLLIIHDDQDDDVSLQRESLYLRSKQPQLANVNANRRNKCSSRKREEQRDKCSV
jgi:hypothetical protein